MKHEPHNSFVYLFQTRNGTLLLVSVYAMVESDRHQRSIFQDMYNRRKKSPSEIYFMMHKSLRLKAGIYLPPGMPMTYAERLFYAAAFDGISDVLGHAYYQKNPFTNKLHRRQVNRIDAVQHYARSTFAVFSFAWNTLIMIAEDLPRFKNVFLGYLLIDSISELYAYTIRAGKAIFSYIERDFGMSSQEKKQIMAELSNVTSTVNSLPARINRLSDKVNKISNLTRTNDNNIETLQYELKNLTSSLDSGFRRSPQIRRPVLQRTTDSDHDIVITRIYDLDYAQPYKSKTSEESEDVIALNFFAQGILLQGNYNTTARYVLNQNHDHLLMEVFLLFTNNKHDPYHSCQRFFLDTTKRQNNEKYRTHHTKINFLDFSHWFDFKTVEYFRDNELSNFQRCSCTCGEKHAFSHIENLERCVCLSNSFYGLARFVTEVKGHIKEFPFAQVLEPHANTHNNLIEHYSPDLSIQDVPSEDSKTAMIAGINAALNQQYLSCATQEFEVECETRTSLQWIASRLASHEFLMSNSTTALKENIRYKRLYQTYEESKYSMTYKQDETPLDFDFRRMIEELRYPPEYTPTIPRFVNPLQPSYSATQPQSAGVTPSKPLQTVTVHVV